MHFLCRKIKTKARTQKTRTPDFPGKTSGVSSTWYQWQINERNERLTVAS